MGGLEAREIAGRMTCVRLKWEKIKWKRNDLMHEVNNVLVDWK